MEKYRGERKESLAAENLKAFTYRDNTNKGEILFQCEAESILEADRQYKEKTGNDVEQQPHIGCTIEGVDSRVV